MHLGQGPKKNLCVESHSFVNSIKLCLTLKHSNSELNILLCITGSFQYYHLTAHMWYQAQLPTCTNESHLSRVLRTNSHAKFSPNEGVIDEICNILKVLSIVLTERKKNKDKFRMQWSWTLLVPTQLPPPRPSLTSLRHHPPLTSYMPQGS